MAIEFDESNVIGNFNYYYNGSIESFSDNDWTNMYGPALNDKNHQYHGQVKMMCDNYANLMCKFVLDNENNLWAKGYNKYGRLGVNSDDLAILEYTKVEFPNRIQFSNIRDILKQKEFDEESTILLPNIIFNISDNETYLTGRYRGQEYKVPTNADIVGLNTSSIVREIKNIDLYLYKDHMVNNSKNNKTENVHIVPSTVQTIDGILLMDNKDIRTGYPKPFILK